MNEIQSPVLKYRSINTFIKKKLGLKIIIQYTKIVYFFNVILID